MKDPNEFEQFGPGDDDSIFIPGDTADIAKKFYAEVLDANGETPMPKREALDQTIDKLKGLPDETILLFWQTEGAKDQASKASKESSRRTTNAIKDAQQLKFDFVINNPDSMSVDVGDDTIAFKHTNPSIQTQVGSEKKAAALQKIEGIMNGINAFDEGNARLIRALVDVAPNATPTDLMDDEGRIVLKAEVEDDSDGEGEGS